MNKIARLEFELAYNDTAVHHFNNYITRTALKHKATKQNRNTQTKSMSRYGFPRKHRTTYYILQNVSRKIRTELVSNNGIPIKFYVRIIIPCKYNSSAVYSTYWMYKTRSYRTSFSRTKLVILQ